MPGREIGLIRTRSAFSLTAPDFRQPISASARHGSRSAEKNPRPQPANETRTKEPTRYKRTPRVIRAGWANLFKDSSTSCFHYSLTTLRSAAKERRVSDADFSVGNGSLFRRLQRAADVNHGAFQMTFTGPFVS